MPVEWTQHRFAGGALALDVANTVVLRAWPDRRFDRFDDAQELPRFAEAARRFREVHAVCQRAECCVSVHCCWQRGPLRPSR